MTTITRAEGLAAIAAWWAERDRGTIGEHFYNDHAVIMARADKIVTAGHMRAAFAPMTNGESRTYQQRIDEQAREIDLLQKFADELTQKYATLTKQHEALVMESARDDETWRNRLDAAYTQRNTLAIAFADLAVKLGWHAGWGRDNDDHKGYDEVWRTVVYVNLPNGKQLSWHMSPDVAPWAKQVLPPFAGEWDGTFEGRTAPEWLSLLPSFELDRASDAMADKMRAITDKVAAKMEVRLDRMLNTAAGLPPVDPFSDDLQRQAAAVTATGCEYIRTMAPLLDSDGGEMVSLAQQRRPNAITELIKDTMAHVYKENAAGRDVVLTQNGKPVMTMYADPAKQSEEMRKPMSVSDTGAGVWPFPAKSESDHWMARALKAEAALRKVESKARHFDILRRLCGFVENGTDTSITIFQDDATCDWVLRVGNTAPAKRRYCESSLERVIDAAALDLPEGEE